MFYVVLGVSYISITLRLNYPWNAHYVGFLWLESCRFYYTLYIVHTINIQRNDL